MTIDFGGVQLDPIEIAINGNAILGIKESGKSYLGTELGEMMFDANIPFVAFDPIGIWHNMRYPGRGKGFPVVVAGGFHGDIPLRPETAPAIVEAAMKQRVSLVLDLFHPELSKADWRKIVRDCAMLLLHKNTEYGLRHVFIEEAAEFVPQQVRDGQVYDAVERVIRMGGNSRLGCTLISPRSQEVNKAVLELCENMFLFRQRGKNALENLKKWLDVAGASGADVMRTLPSMPRGECWAWLGGSDTPVHVRVPPKRSFHPDRRAAGTEAEAPKKAAVNVAKFVGALQAALPKLAVEARAQDPKALQADIAQLQRQLAAAGKANVPGWPDQRQAVSQLHAEAREARARISALEKVIRAAIGDVERLAKTLGTKIADAPAVEAPQPSAASPEKPRVFATAPPIPKFINGALATRNSVLMPEVGEAQSVPSGCAKPLATLAGVYPGGMTEGQWATAAGYKKSGGTWGEYRRRLVRTGMIEQRGDQWHVTPVGAASAGPVELPPAAGPELARWWAKKISGTPKLVEALLENWPHRMSRADLAAAVEMIPTGGSFGEYVRRLKRNAIVREDGDGVILSPEVMGEA